MAEKWLGQNDPSSSPVAVQRGLGSFYNHANFCPFSQPQRKGSWLIERIPQLRNAAFTQTRRHCRKWPRPSRKFIISGHFSNVSLLHALSSPPSAFGASIIDVIIMLGFFYPSLFAQYNDVFPRICCISRPYPPPPSARTSDMEAP